MISECLSQPIVAGLACGMRVAWKNHTERRGQPGPVARRYGARAAVELLREGGPWKKQEK